MISFFAALFTGLGLSRFYEKSGFRAWGSSGFKNYRVHRAGDSLGFKNDRIDGIAVLYALTFAGFRLVIQGL